MIMRANEEHLPWSELTARLEPIVQAIKIGDYPEVRKLLQKLVSGYTPDEHLVDLIYLQRTGLRG